MKLGAFLRVLIGGLTGCFIGGAIAGVGVAFTSMPDLILINNWNAEEAGLGARAELLDIIRNTAGMAIMCGVLGLMYGGPFFFLFGMPAHALLLKRRVTGLIAYAVCGGLISAVCMSFLNPLLNGFRFDRFRLDEILLSTPWYALAGAIAMAIFWLVRRPDRIAPKAEPAA
jgi:hypothetical protein